MLVLRYRAGKIEDNIATEIGANDAISRDTEDGLLNVRGVRRRLRDVEVVEALDLHLLLSARADWPLGASRLQYSSRCSRRIIFSIV